MNDRIPIPRDPANDYTAEMAQQRREFVTSRTGTSLQHVGSFTLDPAQVAGNIENFLGVAQYPSAWPGRCGSTANTRRAISTYRLPPLKARSSRVTTAACACSAPAAE